MGLELISRNLNKLSLNIIKRQILLFLVISISKTNATSTIIIDWTKNYQVSTTFLGEIINQHLTWDDHRPLSSNKTDDHKPYPSNKTYDHRPYPSNKTDDHRPYPSNKTDDHRPLS